MNLKLIPVLVLILLITPTLLAVEYTGVENDPDLPQVEESSDDLTGAIFGVFGLLGTIIEIFGIGFFLLIAAIILILIIMRIAANVLGL